MATHSSVLAWRIPGTGEPGGLLSMGSHRVGHDWSDLAAAAAARVHWICVPNLHQINSLLDGHLGCFHLLTIITMLQRTLGCMYPFEPCLSLDICPDMVLLDHVVVTPRTAACQTSLSFTISPCLLKLVHCVGDAVQPSHPVIHFFFCLQSFPASGPFPMSWLFTSSGQSTEASASALPGLIPFRID